MKRSHGYAMGLALVCSGAFALATGCGSEDPKQTARGEAGAAGSGEGGESGGGSDAAPGGAAGESGSAARGGAGAGGAAAGGAGGAGAGGDGQAAGGANAGAGGEGGAPEVNACVVDGSVEDFAVNSEPIYSVCRGSVLKVEFNATSASARFTCCAASDGDEPFTLPVLGRGVDGFGELSLTIPEAPSASYALSLTCPSGSSDQVIGIQLTDGEGPIVTGLSPLIHPWSLVVIEGQNLGTPGIRVAARRDDGFFSECLFDPLDQTPTSITCSFDGYIEPSTDETDVYFMDVYSPDCGYAPDSPSFLVGNLPE